MTGSTIFNHLGVAALYRYPLLDTRISVCPFVCQAQGTLPRILHLAGLESSGLNYLNFLGFFMNFWIFFRNFWIIWIFLDFFFLFYCFKKNVLEPFLFLDSIYLWFFYGFS